MAAAAKKQQQPPAAAAGAGEPAVVDPKFEWAEKAGSYVLRLVLPGFRKDDFRVQVDGAGRLTVRGTKTGTAGPGSLHKVFQLPSAASHDDIAGRFEAGVLTLTVPKRAAGTGVPAPTSIEEIKRKQPSVAKEEGATGRGEKTRAKEEDALRKAMDEATNKPQEKKMQEEVEEAKPRKQEQHKPASSPSPVKKEEDVKPKAPQAAAAAPSEKPAPATGTDKAKAATMDPESLAERVRRRGEEERAKAAAAAADKEAKAEPEKKGMAAACVGGWKERAMGELKGLTDMKWAEGLADMKWADGVVEAARKNKEVVAVGVAAFSLGFLVSHKLFRK